MDVDPGRRARPSSRLRYGPASAPGVGPPADAGRRAALQALCCSVVCVSVGPTASANSAATTGASGPAARPAADAAYLLKPWPAAKPVPRLDLTDLDGHAWSLSKLKGRPVLLNFWATWCEPCRAEMPSLELLATRFEGDGLLVLSVNYQEALPAIRRFLDVLPFSLPILLDRDGSSTLAWTPRVFPTTVLVDRSGQPLRSVVGELDWTGPVARGLVEPLLTRRR